MKSGKLWVVLFACLLLGAVVQLSHWSVALAEPECRPPDSPLKTGRVIVAQFVGCDVTESDDATTNGVSVEFEANSAPHPPVFASRSCCGEPESSLLKGFCNVQFYDDYFIADATASASKAERWFRIVFDDVNPSRDVTGEGDCENESDVEGLVTAIREVEAPKRSALKANGSLMVKDPAASLEERNGVMYASNENKPFTGRSSISYEDGQKEEEVEYKNGKRHGTATYWLPNGHKLIEGKYRDGKQHGPVTRWYETGQKGLVVEQKDGKLHGKWTQWGGLFGFGGNVWYGWDRERTHHLNLHGRYTVWDENGQKRQEAEYKDGKRHGTGSYWWDKSVKWYECEYRAGKRHGKCTERHQNGQKKTEGEYYDGQLVKETCWNERGQANPCD